MRLLTMLYGVLSYLIFFAVFVYFIGFVGDLFVPKSLSSVAEVSSLNAFLINLGLLLLWGVQHSVMARDWFKEMIASVVPHHVERSTYVLASAIVLAVLMFYWQPMDTLIWHVNDIFWQQVLWLIFGLGWVLVLVATFLTDHFDLFGLRQSWLYFVKKTYTPVVFTEYLFYRWIRHPMMLGLFLAFWATPIMTLGHLVFSIGMSIYVLLGIHYEEKGLAKAIGQPYQDYQQRTSKIIPKVY
jgi:protein-S-isoprenylcysteine O-methyltransferase Ste14|tara:strand:- start:6652 stop:7374 length:723 start_codon:yes stop_codon:yes gene_type:complete